MFFRIRRDVGTTATNQEDQNLPSHGGTYLPRSLPQICSSCMRETCSNKKKRINPPTHGTGRGRFCTPVRFKRVV